MVGDDQRLAISAVPAINTKRTPRTRMLANTLRRQLEVAVGWAMRGGLLGGFVGAGNGGVSWIFSGRGESVDR